MGADACWVCHTCKTVCSRGGRPIFENVIVHVGESKIDEIVSQLTNLSEVIIIEDLDHKLSFLRDLKTWEKRHKGHSTHIGSDYSVDGMDLEDYRSETVVGKVDRMTRHEIQMGMLEDFEKRSLEDIKETIRKHGDNIDDAARELYNRFSVREL